MTTPISALNPLACDTRTLCNRTWWVFLIGGIASLVFGIAAFANPGIALFVLATFFAAAVLVDGAFNILGAIRHRANEGWWLLLLIGVLGAGVGIFALFNPPISMLALVYLIAFQAIFLGVFLLMLGYRVRKSTSREWLLYLSGALSVLFGVLVVVQPAAGGLSIVMIIAAWAVVIGVLRIIFAFRIRSLVHEQPQ